MIEFTVLGGYLGAGKTTLLNHILRNQEGRRIALLINDFGDINLDAQLVESASDQQINLANGCVCCTLSDGFFEAIDTLQQMTPPPEHIIVEASGVADVQNLAQYGYGGNLQLAGIVVVADADNIRTKANDKYVAQTVRRQLEAADLIILNKTDLCSPEQLKDVRAWLQQLTPDCPVIPAQYGEVPLSVLFSLTSTVEFTRPAHHEHEHYVSWSYHGEHPVSRSQLEQFLSALPIEVIRAKGLFPHSDEEIYEAQVVGQRRDVYVRKGKSRSSSEFIAIGLADRLKTEALQALADEHLILDQA